MATTPKDNQERKQDVVLIVDDEPINLKLLRAHLSRQGYKVLEADSGEEALVQVESEPDLILLDIMMPGMDGMETARYLKQNEPSRDIPIIFLSALTDAETKAKGFEAGGVDYVSKPFDSRELIARVSAHLTLRRQRIQIRDYAENLETMVEERTAQLRAAEREVQRDFEIQSALTSLLRYTLDILPLGELMEKALAHLMKLPWLSFSGQSCIFLVSDNERCLELLTNFGCPEPLIKQCQGKPLEGFSCSRSILDKELMIIRGPDAPVGSATLCMPLLHGDTVLGVLNIAVSGEYEPDAKEREFLWAIANTLARVILYKQAEEQLAFHAYYDQLTGLPNRILFLGRLNTEAEKAKDDPKRMFAVLLLDMDRFNIINQSLGHAMGDKLLIAMAERLKDQLGPRDILARLGGDEFAILLKNMDAESYPQEMAERIFAALKTPFTLDGHELFTTSSIGIATSGVTSERSQDMVRDADTALNRAKVMGKARSVVFDHEMHDNAIHLMQLVTDLRQAVTRQEFFLHYQPIVLLQDGSITGFEALVRWNHPKRGLISPGEFIPVAEESDLIIPLGQWVLEEACSKMAPLFAAHKSGLMISVNLSGRQFAQDDLFEQIKDILDSSGLPPHCLKLEITESVIMERAGRAIKTLHDLKSLDVQISIDDFGTGYSSLSYLHRFPADMLKIDRSFVTCMNQGDENLAIVRTIVDLAHNLDMEIIAEGVETEEQIALLKSLGCEYAQGFHYAKPMPGEDIISRNLLDNPLP